MKNKVKNFQANAFIRNTKVCLCDQKVCKPKILVLPSFSLNKTVCTENNWRSWVMGFTSFICCQTCMCQIHVDTKQLLNVCLLNGLTDEQWSWYLSFLGQRNKYTSLEVGGHHGGMIEEELQRPEHSTNPSLIVSRDAWYSLLETR